MINLPNGLKAYLRVPFVMIVWIMETYASNRTRLRVFMAQPRVTTAFKVMLALTAVIWLGIALMAKEESGQRLTDAISDLRSDTESLIEQREAVQQGQKPAQ